MDGECNNIIFKNYELNYTSFLPIFVDTKSFSNSELCSFISEISNGNRLPSTRSDSIVGIV